MNTCLSCGKVMGLHSSILQGCMCQHSMQAPPQRTWVGLTDEERKDLCRWWSSPMDAIYATETKLKELNT